MPFVKKDDYLLSQSVNKALAEGNQEVRLDLVLQKNDQFQLGMVYGFVSDQLGNAIPNAALTLMDAQFNPVWHTLTGQDGTYFIAHLEPGMEYALYASAPGFILVPHDGLVVKPQQEIEINFTLQYNPVAFLSCIAGSVVDNLGHPISGAILRLSSQGNQSDAYHSQTLSNEGGQFVFTELAMGTYLVRVNATGYQPYYENIHIPKQGIILNPTFTLHPDTIKETGVISGRVLDDQETPVANADVILYRIDKDGKEVPVSNVKTLKNGIYLFVNLPVGDYIVKSNKTYRLDQFKS